METFELEEIKDIEMIADVPFPKGIKTRRLIITGTPGSGKSTLLQKLKGWPEEGYLDISSKDWWLSSALQHKPREIHFGLPYFGHERSFPVYDTESLNEMSRLELDIFRIPLPPPKQGPLSPDWRNKFVFEFQVLPAEKVFAYRQERGKRGTHHVDSGLTLARVEEEVNIYRSLALFFHRAGWNVYVRDNYNGAPKRFKESVSHEQDLDNVYGDLVRKRKIYETYDRLRLRQQIILRSWDHQGNKEFLLFFTEIMPKAMGVERCSIFIHDVNNDKVWLQCGTNVTEKQIEVSKQGSVVGDVITNGTTIIKESLHLADGVHKKTDELTQFVTRNILCVPIMSMTSDTVSGAIQVLNTVDNREFNEDDKRQLESLAKHLQVSIENVFLSQEMLDFTTLLSHQINKTGWMVSWWGIALWFMTAAGFGAVISFVAKIIDRLT